MKQKEIKLLLKLLEDYDEVLSNRGCNDMDQSLLKDWTREELIEVDKKYHELNGDPEEHDPDNIISTRMGDSSWLFYLTEKLKEEFNIKDNR